MDTSDQNNNSDNKLSSDVAIELAHITQEIYKKNFELAEKNKILSLLRKIDEVVLGSVTDTYQIGQQVADTIVIDAGFRCVCIYIIEKEGFLSRVAVSQAADLREHLDKSTFLEEVNLEDEKNILVKTVKEQRNQITDDIKLLLNPDIPEDSIKKIIEISDIKSILSYPLKIHNYPIGVLVACVKDPADKFSTFQEDLMSRLINLVGVAIDNALLYKKIKDANDRLKELDHLKDDFVSVASHELRTPMTAIKSYLWMALTGQGGDLNEKQKYYVQRSYNSVDRLIKLVNDMLNISRIDSGRLTVQTQSCSIEKITREILDEVAPRASELGINIALNNKSDLPDVLVDSDKVKEVLYNLIGNSMKFTPGGGHIIVSFEQKDKMIEVMVADDGAGIAAEDLSKLFQKFGILPGSYVTNQPTFGTGLGLYICKSLIELHGGKIWAKSEGKGKGATFIFSLKVFNEEDQKAINEKFAHTSQPGIELIHNK